MIAKSIMALIRKQKYNMEFHPVIEVYRSTKELDRSAAEKIVLSINKAVTERGVAFVALSGGETPRAVYRLLGTAEWNNRIDWNRVHLFFTDERAVPPADSQSNYGMVKRGLISHINIPEKNVHRMKGEKNPELAAAEYERELKELRGDGVVRFDLMFLGIGEDGHTASIFPGTEVVNEEHAFASAVFVPRLHSWRITLTFPVINSTREIVFLAAGKKKNSIIQRVLKRSEPVKNIPATMVRPLEGNLYWMLDEDAAGGWVSTPLK
jgi:6-phosphogluconolactonase